MSICIGPLSECVNALQEIVENLMRIQRHIECDDNSEINNMTSKKGYCDDNNQQIPIDDTPEYGTDCKPFQDDDCQDTPWYCLPPAKSQIVDDECLCQDELSQSGDDDNYKNETNSCNIDTDAGDDCFDKIEQQKSSNGYQRIIAVRENCDGSVSKIYALRKNIKPPIVTARKMEDLNESPNKESKRGLNSRSCINPEDNSEKSSLQSFRYRNNNNGLKENKTNCDDQVNQIGKFVISPQKNSTKLTSNGKNYSVPQALISSVNEDNFIENPFDELESIIKTERKRLDKSCNDGDKLLSSIEKERKTICDHSNDKRNKYDCEDEQLKPNIDNCNEKRQNSNYNYNQAPSRCSQIKSVLQQYSLKPKQKLSRVQKPLSEEEAKKLIDQLIDTTIIGCDKIAKSLNCQSQNPLAITNKGSNLTSCEIEILRKHREDTEQKMNCLRKNICEMLVNMSKILSSTVDVPEIDEMANELNVPDCKLNSKYNK